MLTLPVLLKNPHILLIGGGKVAFQKATILCDNRIKFCVCAREFCPEFSTLNVDVMVDEISSEIIDQFNIVVDATGSEAVGLLLREQKKKRFLFVNRVDTPSECDFYFSTLLNYSPLKIAISTDGFSPTIGQVVREKIKSVLPKDIHQLVRDTGRLREQGIIDRDEIRKSTQLKLAQIYLIGCGPGDVNLLTLQAYQLIQEMDVVLYDHLISDEIMEIIPSKVEKIYVGKQKGHHSYTQDEINRLLHQHATEGHRVGRLKSGDPFIFGRGAEEVQSLVKHGVSVQVVPGLSSSLSGPTLAGIPLTARGYATNLSIVSAHLAGNRFNHDWLSLLHLPQHTTVVLMGLSFAAQIASAALESGVEEILPVAIISNASRANQKIIISSVARLAHDACSADKPALLVFGAVVNLHCWSESPSCISG